IYTAVLALITITFVVSLATRTTLRMDIIRDRGALGREVPGGMIENVYRLQFMNASESPLTITLSATGVPELSVATGDQGATTVQDDAASNKMVPVVVRVPVGQAAPRLHDIELKAVATYQEGSDTTVVERSSFFVPK